MVTVGEHPNVISLIGACTENGNGIKYTYIVSCVGCARVELFSHRNSAIIFQMNRYYRYSEEPDLFWLFWSLHFLKVGCYLRTMAHIAWVEPCIHFGTFLILWSPLLNSLDIARNKISGAKFPHCTKSNLSS